MEPLPSALSAIDSKKQALVRGIAELLNPHSALDKLRQVLASVAEDIRGQADSQDAAMSVMPDVAAQGRQEVLEKGLPIAGMFLGPNSKLSPESKDNLAKAMEMAYIKEVPDEQVRAETGWFQGPDSGFRTELTDHKATINPDFYRQNAGTKGFLPDLLNHPELYKAYPFLRNTEARLLDWNTPYMGSADIQLTPDKGYGTGMKRVVSLREAMPTDQARLTALHEVQHLIQHDESFSPGGDTNSPDVIRFALDRMKQLYPDLSEAQLMNGIQSDPKLMHDFGQQQLLGYKRLAGEAEARLTETRADLSPRSRQLFDPYQTGPGGLDVRYNNLLLPDGQTPRQRITPSLLQALQASGLQAP